MKRILLAILLLVVLMLLAPFFLSGYGVLLMTEISIMAIFAMSLGLIMGYAGMLSLGHGAFFGIGAYTIALLSKNVSSTYMLLIVAVLFSAIIALLTGAIFLRTSKFYLLMITLAFGQMVYALVFQSSWTGGSDGISVAASLNFGFGDIASTNALYYTMGIAFIFLYALLRFFIDSPAGKITKGIMENESRMKALGYQTYVYKLLVYTISGTLAGLAGALYAYFNLFVSPELTYWTFSGDVLLMVIIGGVGTLMGPAVGAGVFIVLQNIISSYTERWPLILGVILVVIVLVGRGGVIHWLSILGTKIRKIMSKEVSKQQMTEDQKFKKSV